VQIHSQSKMTDLSFATVWNMLIRIFISVTTLWVIFSSLWVISSYNPFVIHLSQSCKHFEFKSSMKSLANINMCKYIANLKWQICLLLQFEICWSGFSFLSQNWIFFFYLIFFFTFKQRSFVYHFQKFSVAFCEKVGFYNL
jgi:hypothetical protein